MSELQAWRRLDDADFLLGLRIFPLPDQAAMAREDPAQLPPTELADRYPIYLGALGVLAVADEQFDHTDLTRHQVDTIRGYPQHRAELNRLRDALYQLPATLRPEGALSFTSLYNALNSKLVVRQPDLRETIDHLRIVPSIFRTANERTPKPLPFYLPEDIERIREAVPSTPREPRQRGPLSSPRTRAANPGRPAASSADLRYAQETAGAAFDRKQEGPKAILTPLPEAKKAKPGQPQHRQEEPGTWRPANPNLRGLPEIPFSRAERLTIGEMATALRATPTHVQNALKRIDPGNCVPDDKGRYTGAIMPLIREAVIGVSVKYLESILHINPQSWSEIQKYLETRKYRIFPEYGYISPGAAELLQYPDEDFMRHFNLPTQT